MKKSLSKILARMAKDGDIETVAEIIEEMIESPETPEEAIGEAVAETIVPAAEEIAKEAEETPETTNDEATLADIVIRLDRIIELLTPGPASDELNRTHTAGEESSASRSARGIDPIEEIAEAVEEAIEAAEQNPADDGEEGEVIDPEEIAEIVEEILEPVPAEAISEILYPIEDECEEEEEEKEVLNSSDALRAALKAVRPALAKMPRKQRMRVSKDIAARLRKQNGRRGADAGIYAAITAAKRKPASGNPTDLGKRIMASRNINFRK